MHSPVPVNLGKSYANTSMNTKQVHKIRWLVSSDEHQKIKYAFSSKNYVINLNVFAQFVQTNRYKQR